MAEAISYIRYARGKERNGRGTQEPTTRACVTVTAVLRESASTLSFPINVNARLKPSGQKGRCRLYPSYVAMLFAAPLRRRKKPR